MTIFHFLQIMMIVQLNTKRLKVIAVDAGIQQNFTPYTIRHSWTAIATFMRISTVITSKGLGHSFLETTEIYLKRFDNNTLDEANERIVI